ncbi:MAG: hypothetical protein K6G87_15195 [Butyrivibrio sp.]|uniref:type III-D CRISPR-associated protein Csx19 n=1 Tax=Butyrivibrio sp. TaxID=28121 RepID=UPI0025DE0930|nr:CRISPR-associated protein Csx19 [Butyrivibrio sp.]MCR5772563.1 hypothetical protein [Butyrivibrio sp.]
MNRDWKNSGVCSEAEISEKVHHCDYEYFIAYQTDRFLSGSKKTGTLDGIEWGKLLEIRLFSETQEFLARRTMIGTNNPFQWRVASEENLKDDEYIIKYQTLDIDSTHTSRGESGNLHLMTTGGGKYELPIEEDMAAVKVISYISYSDKDGMAFIYDNRLAGFVKEGEANV